MSTTSKEIVEAQRRHRRLSERSKTIVADLRKLDGLEFHYSKACFEAAEVIEWLQEQVAGYRKDLMEEAKETADAERESGVSRLTCKYCGKEEHAEEKELALEMFLSRYQASKCKDLAEFATNELE